MATEARMVVLETVLRDLLDGVGQAASRKNLARALGVSDATISHYLSGRARPSFAALTAMAQFFNISLDFLVFGERPAPSGEDDPVGIRTQIRRALIESSDSAGRHADMVARITARLHSEIEQVAEDLVNSSSVSHPVGFVTDSEAIAMETCIRGMKIMTRIFQSDLNDGEPGPFFEVVVENLRRDCPYQYLLYGDRRALAEDVAAFRSLVEQAGVPNEQSRLMLQFKVLAEELISPICILELDRIAAERREPILWERHVHNVSADGSWAYISVERADAQGGIVMESHYLSSALRQFRRDWERASKL